MNEGLVSVIMPIFNVQDCLDLSIKSVLDQSYKKLEVILVDDGSTDRCGEICDLWVKKDNRVKCVHKKNGGLSDARNYGMKYATGEYISFIDSDDYISPNFYEKLLSIMKKYEVKLACCRFDIFDEIYHAAWYNEAPTADGHDECMDSDVFLKNMLTFSHGYTTTSVWDRLYHRSIIENLFFPKGKNYEDILYSTQAICNAQRIGYLDECLYHYRVRKGSISNDSSVFDRRIITDMFFLRDEQLCYLRERRLNDIFMMYRSKYVSEAAYYLSINPYREYDEYLKQFINRWKIKHNEVVECLKHSLPRHVIKSCFPYVYAWMKNRKG